MRKQHVLADFQQAEKELSRKGEDLRFKKKKKKKFLLECPDWKEAPLTSLSAFSSPEKKKKGKLS